MYCTQCGFKLEDDMKMCPICGAEVEKSAPSVDEGRTTEQQIQQEPVMQAQENLKPRNRSLSVMEIHRTIMEPSKTVVILSTEIITAIII